MTGLDGIHHIGITVRDVDRSLAFWTSFLGVEASWRTLLDGDYLGGVTGYPGVNLDAAVVPLPGGGVLEILDYRRHAGQPNDDATANPGNVHICFGTSDIDVMRERAIAAGATPVSPGPTEVAIGPNAGAKACYLRDPDGITLELFQRPPPSAST